MPALFRKLVRSPMLGRNDCRKLPTKGVYVFFEGSKAIYVGRSKNLPSRILSHGRPSCGHNSASFAFLLAKEKAMSKGMDIKRHRNSLQSDPKFKSIYDEQKARISRMKIKAVDIEDSETEAVFEIYASKRLRTRYNTFNTH